MKAKRKATDDPAQRPLLPSDHAFVVQFQARTGCGRPAYAGRVEHLTSGRATHFQVPEEMLSFTRQVLSGLNGRAAPRRPRSNANERLEQDRAQDSKGEER